MERVKSPVAFRKQDTQRPKYLDPGCPGEERNFINMEASESNKPFKPKFMIHVEELFPNARANKQE